MMVTLLDFSLKPIDSKLSCPRIETGDMRIPNNLYRCLPEQVRIKMGYRFWCSNTTINFSLKPIDYKLHFKN